MKQLLKRWCGKNVFVFLPYGLCLVGKLRQDNELRGFVVVVDPKNLTVIKFFPEDLIAVNNSNYAFWLKGAKVSDFPHIKKIIS